MFFIKIYIKESYMNCYHTSIQMCGQYCILAQGGNYVVNLLDNHGAPISILFICFLEAVAVNWCYGKLRLYLL